MTNVDMSIDAVATQRLIAHLMSASVPVEEHLRQGKPLTTQQFESLSLTIEGEILTQLRAGQRIEH